eukprot:687864-Pyramimonas_sp.AAC.1
MEVEEEFDNMREEGKVDEMNSVFMHVVNEAALEVFTESPLASEKRKSQAERLGNLLEQRRNR